MKIDDILQGNVPLLFMERYVDEAAKTYSPFAGKSETAPEYRPRSDRQSFELVTVYAPTNRVSLFEADPTEILQQHYVQPDGVLFAVHPETWSSSGIDCSDELHALPRGDSFIGRELFDYLLGVLKRNYAVDEAGVRRRVVAAFHRSFPDSDRFLPPNRIYYFSNEILPGNEFQLVDLKRAPEWR